MSSRVKHYLMRFAIALTLSLILTSLVCLLLDPEIVPAALIMVLFACLPAIVFLVVEAYSRKKWYPSIGFILGTLPLYLTFVYGMLFGEPAAQSMAFFLGGICTLACVSMFLGLYCYQMILQYLEKAWKIYAPLIYMMTFLVFCAFQAGFFLEVVPYWMRNDLVYHCISGNGGESQVSGYYVPAPYFPYWKIDLKIDSDKDWSQADLHLDERGPDPLRPITEDASPFHLYWSSDITNVNGTRKPPAEIKLVLNDSTQVWRRTVQAE